MNIENTLNIVESSKFVGVSRPTFYKLISRYGIKEKVVIGTVRLFDKADLLRLREAIAK